MAKVSLQSTFAISPDEVWKLIGKFNALPDWHPAIQSSKLEDGGRLRRLSILALLIPPPLVAWFVHDAGIATIHAVYLGVGATEEDGKGWRQYRRRRRW